MSRDASLAMLVASAFLAGFLTCMSLWTMNVFPLNPQAVYYEMPNGGYIYEDDYPLEYGGKCIRFNYTSYNGTLDYQVTLNPEKRSKTDQEDNR